MYQKFAILLLKGSPKQTFWAMELFGKFPKKFTTFQGFSFLKLPRVLEDLGRFLAFSFKIAIFS
jgi:hypothetical protein